MQLTVNGNVLTITATLEEFDLRQNHDKDGKLIDKHYVSLHTTKNDMDFQRNGEAMNATRFEVTLLGRNVVKSGDRAAKKTASGLKAATTRLANAANDAPVDDIEASIKSLQAILDAKLSK